MTNILLSTFFFVFATSTPPQFICDKVQKSLFWEFDGATLRADADGISLSAITLAKPMRTLPYNAGNSFIKLEFDDNLNNILDDDGSPLTKIIIKGKQVSYCYQRKCRAIGNLPFTVVAAFLYQQGAIIAGATPVPGLYYLNFSYPLSPAMMIGGRVYNLCSTSNKIWALVEYNNDITLVTLNNDTLDASIDSPKKPQNIVNSSENNGNSEIDHLASIRIYRFGEALLSAINHSVLPATSLASAFTMAAKNHLPELEAMLIVALNSQQSNIKSLAASIIAKENNTKATERLKKLSIDTVSEVRRAALDAIAKVSTQLPREITIQRLQFFKNDQQQDIAWKARDLLMPLAPELALLDAPTEYKIDAVTILLARCKQNGENSIKVALRILQKDDDDAVRSAANTLIECDSQ
ncbi:MAG: HEAT repeat domain-containing protein [Deltaproteobacteria bacterium]|nr:HEAT repeat domain-containing protein [Deltaproteobacteria bacterium]